MVEVETASAGVMVGDLVPFGGGVFRGPNTWAKVVDVQKPVGGGFLLIITRTGRTMKLEPTGTVRVRRKRTMAIGGNE